MKVLITGAKGFIGRNLVEALKSIKDGKDCSRGSLVVEEVLEYDLDSPPASLEDYCRRADFVFNLAGVNRPKNESQFKEGNFDFLERLLAELKRQNNRAPVMLSSSIQASLLGRFAGSEYGRTKAEAERLLFDYSVDTGSPVYVYRLPGVFGKWARPSYNSVVATFCHNVANDLPITVNDESTELTLVYIDDLIDSLISLLKREAQYCEYNGLECRKCDTGRYVYLPITHKVTLGEIVRDLKAFKEQPRTLLIPDMAEGSFRKKLFSTYLSYLPPESISFPIVGKEDQRGSFTELIKTSSHGQFSLNVSKPGITKGQHWHNSKWEIFIVIKGKGRIEQRRVGSDEVISVVVCGDEPKAVYMLPGYTHNIINLSETEELLTLMWANECFDPSRPDTFSLPV